PAAVDDVERPDFAIGIGADVVAVDEVQRFAVGGDGDAVGAADRGLRDDASDFAVRVDAIYGLVLVLHDRAIRGIERVGEPDAAGPIDHDVVGAVVAFAFVAL